jgi:hypothetical protein
MKRSPIDLAVRLWCVRLKSLRHSLSECQAGLASLFFRQTNILWIGFVAAVSLTRLLERSPRIRHPLLGNSVPGARPILPI